MAQQYHRASSVLSAHIEGFRATPVFIEVDLAPGLHQFRIVGLPDKAVEEARERVSSALRNSNAKPPQHHNRRITINLAPADTKKHGAWFDLGIALSFLIASQQLTTKQQPLLAVGELGLDGAVRPVQGVLAAAMLAKDLNALLVLPAANSAEADLIAGLEILAVSSLEELLRHLEQESGTRPTTGVALETMKGAGSDFDLGFVRGQEQAKRALEIAAAGNHNIFMSGPPGAGKTLLARTLPTILPSLTPEEMIEVTTIWSVAGLLHAKRPLLALPPFRAPHHSASRAALIGGGSGRASPGEVTLAHRGVLFLDELPEFPRHVLEALRQPVEDGFVTVSRSEKAATYPARFLLLAAQNPCPCGNATDPERDCTCSSGEIHRYRRRVSGPLLDRLDLFVDVPRISFEKLRTSEETTSSADVQRRVEHARAIQRSRFTELSFSTNAEIPIKYIDHFCALDHEGERLLQSAHDAFHLSPRGLSRVLKVTRTIADLAGEERMKGPHLAEAIRYRYSLPA